MHDDGPLDFFDRWERQGWRLGDIDLQRDVAGWAALGAFTGGELEDGVLQFFLGESAVTDTLGPIITASPTAEAQIFLCTQLADEARHALFFSRYLETVRGGAPEGLRERQLEAWSDAPAALSDLLDCELRRVSHGLRDSPTRERDWYAALVLYHLTVEGVLAFSGQRAVLDVVGDGRRLPALAEGMEHIARDEARHIGFGVAQLAEGRSAGFGDAIAEAILRYAPVAAGVLVHPERRSPSLLPAIARRAWGQGLRSRWDTARSALSSRVRVIGFDDELTAVLEEAWDENVERALDRYEELHAVSHPARGVREAA